MTITTEIKNTLERENKFCSSTINFYRRQIKLLEKKYSMTTASFLRKFENGEIGDDQDYFDWYAFYQLISGWKTTKKALQPLIK